MVDHDAELKAHIQRRKEFIAANIGLVDVAIRKYFSWSEEPYEDMLQEGIKGLARGFDKHDPSRGGLTTCAVWYIRGSISGYLRKRIAKPTITNWDMARVDTESERPPAFGQYDGVQELIAKLLWTLPDPMGQVLSMRFLRGMTLQKAGDELGVTKERVRQIQIAALKRLRQDEQLMQQIAVYLEN